VKKKKGSTDAVAEPDAGRDPGGELGREDAKPGKFGEGGVVVARRGCPASVSRW